MSNIKLQYQLSNGSWVDCDERTDEFLALCVEYSSGIETTKEAIEALLAGKELRNDAADWYSNCRSEIPVIAKREAAESAKKRDAAEKKQKMTESACNIYLRVSYQKKDIAKSHGAKWDAREKQWYYPSAAGEYLPDGLIQFDTNSTMSEESSRRFDDTGLDWYDR